MEFENFELVKFYELIKVMTLKIKVILKYKFLEKNNNRIMYFIFF